MGHFASNDPVFRDAFFVEDHDLRNWEDLAAPLKRIVLVEAAAGNKVFGTVRHRNPQRIAIQLMAPPRNDWSQLPEGTVICSEFTMEFPVYDSDVCAIFDVASGDCVAFGDPDAWKARA
jgi:hypothetical protein